PACRWRAVAAARMSFTTRRTQSRGACDILRRKTLTPASISRPSISGESVAGPRVAMILVRRMRELGFRHCRCDCNARKRSSAGEGSGSYSDGKMQTRVVGESADAVFPRALVGLGEGDAIFSQHFSQASDDGKNLVVPIGPLAVKGGLFQFANPSVFPENT